MIHSRELHLQRRGVLCYLQNSLVEEFFRGYDGPSGRKCNSDWQVHPNAIILLLCSQCVATSRCGVSPHCLHMEDCGSKGLLGAVTSAQSRAQLNLASLALQHLPFAAELAGSQKKILFEQRCIHFG